MINIYCNIQVNATEDIEQENIVNNEINESIQENYYEKTKAHAIVKEIGKIKELQTDFVVDKIQEIKVEILDGKYKAKQIIAEYVISYDLNENVKSYDLKEGDKVIVEILKDENQNLIATVQDVSRSTPILICFIMLLILILSIGNKNGIKTICIFIISLLIIYFILIKGIFNGNNVFFVTLFTSILIIILNLLILNGFNKTTLISILGTIGGILSCCILTSIFINIFKLSGVSEEVIYLSMNMNKIVFNFKDLLFAGIIISILRNLHGYWITNFIKIRPNKRQNY